MFHIKEFFEYILSILLPKDKNVLEIEKISEEDIFKNTTRANILNDQNVKAIFKYKNKIIKKAIWEIKYNKNKIIIKKFGKILYDFIIEELSDEILFSNFQNPLLIPVPISKNNLRDRGYNQCEEIIKEIKQNDTQNIFEISFDSLKKMKETPHQSKLNNKTKRLNNLKNCFFANSEQVKNRNIILIDDVITTGATMSENRRELKKSGAKKVIGIAIAH